VPAASGLGRDIYVQDCEMRGNTDAPAVSLEGRSGISANYSNIHVQGCRINAGSVGTNYAVRLGTAANPLLYAYFARNTVLDADGSGGLETSAEHVHLEHNTFLGSGTLGIDMLESNQGFVQSNLVSGFTTAFDMEDATELIVRDNVFDATTAVVWGEGPNYDYANQGVPTIVRSTTTSEVTIPANRVGPGDIIRVSRTIRNGGLGAGDMEMRVGGKLAASITSISVGENARIDAELYVLSTTQIRANMQTYKTSGWGHTTTVITGIDTTAPFTIASSNPGFTATFRHGLRVELVQKNYEELP